MPDKKFEEPEALNHVAEFHHMFDLPVVDVPTVPSKQRCDLRLNLLQEELDELKEAIEDKDILEISDALSDLQYVLSGAILEFGLASIFKSLFDEVQRSNMSKTCKSEEEALATQDYYLQVKNSKSNIEKKDGEFLVKRIPDGKILKSINYSPADLKSILLQKEPKLDKPDKRLLDF